MEEQIVSYPGSDGEAENFSEEVVDEHGIKLVKSKKSETQDEVVDDDQEEQENLDIKDDTGTNPKTYARIQELAGKNKDLERKLVELENGNSDDTRDANAFRELMKDPKFQKTLGSMLVGEKAVSEGKVPTLDDVDFEKMTDKQIMERMTDYNRHLAKADTDATNQKIADLATVIQGLSSKIEAGEVKSLLNDENFPDAKKHETSIKETMRKFGVSKEQAYYMVKGPELLKTGETKGHKTAQKKGSHDVHVHTKKVTGKVDVVEKVATIQDAYRAACKEEGVEPDPGI